MKWQTQMIFTTETINNHRPADWMNSTHSHPSIFRIRLFASSLAHSLQPFLITVLWHRDTMWVRYAMSLSIFKTIAFTNHFIASGVILIFMLLSSWCHFFGLSCSFECENHFHCHTYWLYWLFGCHWFVCSFGNLFERFCDLNESNL